MAWVDVAAKIKFYNGWKTLVGTHHNEPMCQVSTTPFRCGSQSMLRRTLCVALTVVLAACAARAAEEPRQAPQGLQPPHDRLTDSEIASAIESHAVVISRGDDNQIMIAEAYCDGRFALEGTRVPIYGTYAIRDDLLCTVVEQRGERCAQIYRSETGQLFRRHLSDPGATLVPLDIVELECAG